MTHLREKNLRALRRCDAALARRLENSVTSATLELLSARSGEPVPAVRRQGRSVALHSLFDPTKEAARLVSAVLTREKTPDSPSGPSGYFLFEGIGGGYHVRHLLAHSEPAYVLIIECHTELLGELLSMVDLSDILADARVHLLVDPSVAETAAYLKSTYLPGVMGGFYSVPLRSRIDIHPDFFASQRVAIRGALEETANDYTVQSGFGRLWTRNILTNLPCLARSRPATQAIDDAIVTAAGPSLEDRMGELTQLRPGRFLIATDTSLPALLAAKLRPDAVLTIDSQYLSYYHFLSGLPSSSVLVAELAAPPAVVRLARNVTFVSSGHPLSKLAASELGGIIPIDTSGGNVGHAAVSLALELDARSVHLLGSDFSYPFGKPYARGAFVYDYFAEREIRTSPTEAGIAGLLYRYSAVDREPISGGLRYTTGTLRAYRDRFLASFADRGEVIHPIVAHGLPLDLKNAAVRSRTASAGSPMRSSLLSEPPSEQRVRRFLSEYRDAVAALPPRIPQAPAGGLALPLGQWSVFATIYPLIAHLRHGSSRPAEVETLITNAKSAVESIMERVIKGWYS